MKIKKIIAIVACVGASIATMSVCASATTAKPYSTYKTSISSGWGSKKTATAYITKCSCNPVNNWLAACIKVQYKDGNNYVWDPVDDEIDGYYYQNGYNMNEARISVSHDNITYAKSFFEAKCGTGSMQTWTDDAS